jgi:hypothetical protein
LRPYAPHKLAPRSQPCVFIGYSTIHKGYKCLDLTTNRVYIFRHVVFDETIFPFQQSLSLPPAHISSPVPAHSSALTILPSSSLSDSFAQPSFAPTSSPSSSLLSPFPLYYTCRSKEPPLDPQAHLTFPTTHPADPTTFLQAVKHDHWRKAMEAEMHALKSNNTWVLVSPDTVANVVGSK